MTGYIFLCLGKYLEIGKIIQPPISNPDSLCSLNSKEDFEITIDEDQPP